MSLPILTYPNAILRKPALLIKSIDEDIVELSKSMLKTMYDHNGVGLAATQLGISVRLVVIDISPTRNQPIVLINPELVFKSNDKVIVQEACLSFPELGPRAVKSFRNVVVKYQDIQGVFQEMHCTGLMAACVQHEIDHLNGKLLIDRRMVGQLKSKDHDERRLTPKEIKR
jgi:peptide deformylase